MLHLKSALRLGNRLAHLPHWLRHPAAVGDAVASSGGTSAEHNILTRKRRAVPVGKFGMVKLLEPGSVYKGKRGRDEHGRRDIERDLFVPMAAAAGEGATSPPRRQVAPMADHVITTSTAASRSAESALLSTPFVVGRAGLGGDGARFGPLAFHHFLHGTTGLHNDDRRPLVVRGAVPGHLVASWQRAARDAFSKEATGTAPLPPRRQPPTRVDAPLASLGWITLPTSDATTESALHVDGNDDPCRKLSCKVYPTAKADLTVREAFVVVNDARYSRLIRSLPSLPFAPVAPVQVEQRFISISDADADDATPSQTEDASSWIASPPPELIGVVDGLESCYLAGAPGVTVALSRPMLKLPRPGRGVANAGVGRGRRPRVVASPNVHNDEPSFAPAVDVHLDAGDVLYVPRGWRCRWTSAVPPQAQEATIAAPAYRRLPLDATADGGHVGLIRDRHRLGLSAGNIAPFRDVGCALLRWSLPTFPDTALATWSCGNDERRRRFQGYVAATYMTGDGLAALYRQQRGAPRAEQTGVSAAVTQHNAELQSATAVTAAQGRLSSQRLVLDVVAKWNSV